MTEQVQTEDEVNSCAVEEMTIPVAVLHTLQGNMLADAAMSLVGMVIAHSAIDKYPELNEADRYSATKFSAQLNSEIDRFRMGSKTVYSAATESFLGDLDNIIDKVAAAWNETLAQLAASNRRMVAGTMFVNARQTDVMMTVDLSWVDEENKSE